MSVNCYKINNLPNISELLFTTIAEDYVRKTKAKVNATGDQHVKCMQQIPINLCVWLFRSQREGYHKLGGQYKKTK